jgi:D-lactate dehydrogenase
MEEIRIAFFDTKPFDQDFFDRMNTQFGYTFKYFRSRLTPDSALLSQGSNVVCAFVNDIISAPVIDTLAANGIQLIALRSAGYNNVDFRAAYGRIHVVRVPAYSPYAVAEHAVALMLSLNRKIHRAYYRTRDGNFNINGLLGFDMYEKTAGIIGTGKIGKVAVNILRGFGMRVLGYDAFPDLEFAAQTGMEYADLDTIYRESDIISLHCPLNRDTFHLINAESISKMKNGVMIINTGRGQLLDTPDLIEALKSEKVGSAGLDVYEEESAYFFEDFSSMVISDDVLARLLSFHNVLVTSHQGFFTTEALTNIAEVTLNNIRDFFRGERLVNEICYKCDEHTCRKEEAGRCF